MTRSKFVLTARLLAAVALLLCSVTQSAAQVKAPPLGIARLADGTLRKLYGLPANVVVDSHSLGTFDAASFSDSAGLVAKEGRIQLVTASMAVVGEYDSAEAAPLLNVDGSVKSAIAWLPTSQSLVYWNGNQFEQRTVNGLDEGLQASAVRAQSGGLAQLLLTDGNGAVFQASVSLETGNVLSVIPLPGAGARAFWLGEFVLSQDANGLEVTAPNGNVRKIALDAGELTFTHISAEWVLLSSASENRSWAVRMTEGIAQLSEAPTVGTAAQGVKQ